MAKDVAWVLNEHNTHLRSRFIWPVTFDFYVVGLDSEYQIMALGHPFRKYGWIMARSPELSEKQYMVWLSKMEHLDYAKNQFLKVPQKPTDTGKQGF